MHDLTEEDLRQIWLDLYLHAVKSSNCITPAIVHGHARETADAYVALLRADMDARDKVAAEKAREAAGNGEAVILPQAPTAEMKRVPVGSLKVGDRVLLLGTVEDICDPDDDDAIQASVCLDGDDEADAWTHLRLENVVYRAPAQMGDEP